MPKLSLLLVPALAACAMSTPAPAPAASPNAAMASMPMTGVFTTTVAEADVPASVPAEMRGGLVGRWELNIDRPGHALVSYNGQQVVDSPFQVQGNTISFAPDADTGPYACHAAAHYTWAMTSAGLRFTKLDDACEGRAVALTAHPWTPAR
jgi:hypothetical protein